MKRAYLFRLILVALAAVILLIALIELPGGAQPSVGQAAVTRSPRPHPTSHLSLPPGIDLSNPRPHPTSHIGRSIKQP